MSALRVSRAALLRCLVSFCLMAFCSPLLTSADLKAAQQQISGEPSASTEPDAKRISFQPRAGSPAVGTPMPRAVAVPAANNDETSKVESPTAVITEAHYKVTAEKTTARVSCRLVVQVLQGPWAKIPVNFGDAAVGTLKSDKADAAFLKGNGNGRFALSVKGEGRHEIQFELLVKIDTSSKNAVAAFAGPPAGITTFEAVVPGDNRQLAVSPTLVHDKTVKQTAGQSRVKGHLTAASTIKLSWKPQATANPVGKNIVTANQITKMRLRDDTLFAETRMNFRTTRDALSELKLVAPLSVRILDVNAAKGRIRNWAVAKTKTAQLITVTLMRPVEDSVAVTVHTQKPLKEGETKLAGLETDGVAHGVHAFGVTRETGLLIVSPDARWDITVPAAEGWIPVDLADIAKSDRPALGTAMRFFRVNSPLTAEIVPVSPRVNVAQSSTLKLQPTMVALQSRLQFRVERIGILDLKIRLPKGLTVQRVTADHLLKYDIDSKQSPPILRLTFDRKLLGPLSVNVEAHRATMRSAKPTSLELPILEPIDVAAETGVVQLAAANSLAVSIDPTKTTGATSAPPSTDQPSSSELPTVASWTYASRPVRITATVTPRNPRLTGKLGTVIAVRESGIAQKTTLTFLVEHAPQSRFRFAVPAKIADSLRVTDSDGQPLSVRQLTGSKSEVKPPQADGKGNAEPTAWTTLEWESPQPVTGKVVLVVHNDLAFPALGGDEPADDDAKTAAELKIEPVRLLGIPAGNDAPALPITEILGEVRVHRDVALKVDTNISGLDAEAIDVRELQILSQSDGEHYRYHRQPVSLSLSIQKLNIEHVAETVISRGLVEVLLGQEASATYRCRYRLVSSERQRMRIDLPISCEPLAVTVNGRAVPLERNPSVKPEESWASYLIDISRPESSNTPFSVALQFRLPITPEPFQFALGRVQLHLPRLLDKEGTPAVVQELRTAIWVPERFALVGTADRFTRKTATRLTGLGPDAITAGTNAEELNQWIGVANTGVLAFPTEGHYYRFDTIGTADQLELTYANVPFATWVVGIPLLLIGFILAKTTWQNRVSLGLLLIFATLFAAVRWSNEVYHGLLAARYGLVAVAVWWTVHGLYFYRPQPATEPDEATPPDTTEPITLPVGALPAVVVPPPGLFEA